MSTPCSSSDRSSSQAWCYSRRDVSVSDRRPRNGPLVCDGRLRDSQADPTRRLRALGQISEQGASTPTEPSRRLRPLNRSHCGERGSADDAEGRTSYGANLEHRMIPGVRQLREARAHDATGDFAVPGDNGSQRVDWDLDGVEGFGSALAAQFAPTGSSKASILAHSDGLRRLVLGSHTVPITRRSLRGYVRRIRFGRALPPRPSVTSGVVDSRCALGSKDDSDFQNSDGDGTRFDSSCPGNAKLTVSENAGEHADTSPRNVTHRSGTTCVRVLPNEHHASLPDREQSRE